MDQMKIMDIHVQLRCIYNLLGEVMDLSRQLEDALNYNDQVTVQMLLGMREEPLQKLVEIKSTILQQLSDFPFEEAEHLRLVLNGAAAGDPAEKMLADQAAMNERLLRQVQELDQKLNLKITQGNSIYMNKNRK